MAVRDLIFILVQVKKYTRLNIYTCVYISRVYMYIYVSAKIDKNIKSQTTEFYVFVYVCVCVYIYIYTHIYIYTYIYIYIYIYVCVCVCVCVCVKDTRIK